MPKLADRFAGGVSCTHFNAVISAACVLSYNRCGQWFFLGGRTTPPVHSDDRHQRYKNKCLNHFSSSLFLISGTIADLPRKYVWPTVPDLIVAYYRNKPNFVRSPSLLGRLFFTTLKQLKMTAKVIGARPVGSAFIGRTSAQARPPLPDETKKRVQKLAAKLM